MAVHKTGAAEIPTSGTVTTNVIEDILGRISPDLELVDYKLKPATAAGDNYMSVMFSVEINPRARGNLKAHQSRTSQTSSESMYIMLKTMPQQIIRQQLLVQLNSFEREAKVYEEVFPAMAIFQQSQGSWDEKEIFDRFPKCYATFCNGKSDYIAMEDLTLQGFKMVDRRVGLDFSHSSLVVQNMARMHAISYAMFQGDWARMRRAFPYLEEKLILSLDQMADVMRTFFLGSLSREAKLLRENGFENEARVIDALGSEEYCEKQYRLVGRPVPNAVFGHGDCWTNNIMFKYTEDDISCASSPTELKFVDFQNSRVCSRMIDFSTFLHSSLQMEIMNERWEELLKIYHEEFTSYAKRLGHHDPGLTFDALLEEYSEFKVFGVVMGIIMSPAITADRQDLPDMERLPDAVEHTSDRFDQVLGTAVKGETLLARLVNLVNNHALKNLFIVNLVRNIARL